MAKKDKESRFERCEECRGQVLIVFKCKDGKDRCARCKGLFDQRSVLGTKKKGGRA